MSYTDFTSMPVWQNALRLLALIYSITKKFPQEEKFGITADIRRAANSVLHNLAEGYGRFENKDKSRFYKISPGTAYEIISQVLASHLLQYLNSEERDELIDGYKQIIFEQDCLIKSVEQRKTPISKI